MWPNPQFPADLVTFTEEILNGKLHFLCSVMSPIKLIREPFFFIKRLEWTIGVPILITGK